MTILVAASFDAGEWATWWPLLQSALPGETLVRDRDDLAEMGADGIDVAIVANPPPRSLHGLPALRLIQSLWAGVDRVLADVTVPVDVPLARMVDPAMNETMAQTALWAVLGLHREFFDYAAQQQGSTWNQRSLRRADEICVAVLGLGQMGATAAQLLARHGYRVLGWSRSSAGTFPGIEKHTGDAALNAVFAQAQIVLNLLPLTEQTRGLFDARRFARMRRGASFVNLARGAHVVEADLLAALDSGQLHRAVLDVFTIEPLPRDHTFWSHRSITVLPHIAAQTDARTAAKIAARNVQSLRRGLPIENLVDRSAGY
jgi:glyoxylate/hydroxypyruvate reductase A